MRGSGSGFPGEGEALSGMFSSGEQGFGRGAKRGEAWEVRSLIQPLFLLIWDQRALKGCVKGDGMRFKR